MSFNLLPFTSLLQELSKSPKDVHTVLAQTLLQQQVSQAQTHTSRERDTPSSVRPPPPAPATTAGAGSSLLHQQIRSHSPAQSPETNNKQGLFLNISQSQGAPISSVPAGGFNTSVSTLKMTAESNDSDMKLEDGPEEAEEGKEELLDTLVQREEEDEEEDQGMDRIEQSQQQQQQQQQQQPQKAFDPYFAAAAAAATKSHTTRLCCPRTSGCIKPVGHVGRCKIGGGPESHTTAPTAAGGGTQVENPPNRRSMDGSLYSPRTEAAQDATGAELLLHMLISAGGAGSDGLPKSKPTAAGITDGGGGGSAPFNSHKEGSQGPIIGGPIGVVECKRHSGCVKEGGHRGRCKISRELIVEKEEDPSPGISLHDQHAGGAGYDDNRMNIQGEFEIQQQRQQQQEEEDEQQQQQQEPEIKTEEKHQSLRKRARKPKLTRPSENEDGCGSLYDSWGKPPGLCTRNKECTKPAKHVGRCFGIKLKLDRLTNKRVQMRSRSHENDDAATKSGGIFSKYLPTNQHVGGGEDAEARRSKRKSHPVSPRAFPWLEDNDDDDDDDDEEEEPSTSTAAATSEEFGNRTAAVADAAAGHARLAKKLKAADASLGNGGIYSLPGAAAAGRVNSGGNLNPAAAAAAFAAAFASHRPTPTTNTNNSNNRPFSPPPWFVAFVAQQQQLKQKQQQQQQLLQREDGTQRRERPPAASSPAASPAPLSLPASLPARIFTKPQQVQTQQPQQQEQQQGQSSPGPVSPTTTALATIAAAAASVGVPDVEAFLAVAARAAAEGQGTAIQTNDGGGIADLSSAMRELDEVLEDCGIDPEKRLAYSMDVADFSTDRREAVLDMLSRYHDQGHKQAIKMCVERHLNKISNPAAAQGVACALSS